MFSNNIYFWWGLALVLMAAETIVPGAFLLWLGIAAGAMGLLLWLAPEMSYLLQAFAFTLLSFASILVYRRFFRQREPVGDQPLLNRKVQQLIGRTLVLETAIVNGSGKVKMGDALWTVRGPDLPVGHKVLVTDVDGIDLNVRSAQ